MKFMKEKNRLRYINQTPPSRECLEKKNRIVYIISLVFILPPLCTKLKICSLNDELSIFSVHIIMNCGIDMECL